MITREELIAKYPTLFHLAHALECGDGWLDMLDELAGKIVAEMPEVMAVQIKEKFGTLRFYLDYSTNNVETIIEEYERRSERICEVCGKRGKLYNMHGWYRTRCLEHYKEAKEQYAPKKATVRRKK